MFWVLCLGFLCVLFLHQGNIFPPARVGVIPHPGGLTAGQWALVGCPQCAAPSTAHFITGDRLCLGEPVSREHQWPVQGRSGPLGQWHKTPALSSFHVENPCEFRSTVILPVRRKRGVCDTDLAGMNWLFAAIPFLQQWKHLVPWAFQALSHSQIDELKIFIAFGNQQWWPVIPMKGGHFLPSWLPTIFPDGIFMAGWVTSWWQFKTRMQQNFWDFKGRAVPALQQQVAMQNASLLLLGKKQQHSRKYSSSLLEWSYTDSVLQTVFGCSL